MIGAGIVVLFGTPVVHSWLRGVAPYDLSGLSPSTLVGRFPETIPVLLFALGLAALVTTVTANRYVPVVAATILTFLVAVAVVQLDASTPLLTALRLVVVVGGSVVVTALIGVAVLGRPRVTPAGHG